MSRKAFGGATVTVALAGGLLLASAVACKLGGHTMDDEPPEKGAGAPPSKQHANAPAEQQAPGPAAGGSPFAGSWMGRWADPAVHQSGSTVLTIGTDGTLTGTVTNETVNKGGALQGRVQHNGAFSYTYSYPGSGLHSAKGTCALGQNGHLLCNTTNYNPQGQAFGSNVADFTRR